MKTKSFFVGATDATLVEMVISGHEQAFSEIIRRYKSKVIGTISLLVKDRELVKDLAQETWSKVYLLLIDGSYYESGNFVGWICRIGRNLTIDYLRSATHRKKADISLEKLPLNTSLQTAPADEAIIRHQKVKQVLAVLQLLPEDQQLVLRMRMYEELTFREIAEKLNISINTALGRMRYALANLKKILPEKE